MHAAVQTRQRPPALASSAPVVVCGVDDTRADEAIVRFAADLCRRLGGRLILLHVQPPPVLGLEPRIAYAAPRRRPGTARDQLTAARELAGLVAAAGVVRSTEVRLGYGDLAEQLLSTVREEQATLLVVGSPAGSRPGVRGSRVLRLVGRAASPVVVVPVAGGR